VTGFTQCEYVDETEELEAGWAISNLNQTIRFNVSDSENCGGTCDQVQTGWAQATITVGPDDTEMSLDFSGIAELQDTDFENIIFKLDGTQIAKATSQNLDQGCDMGPVIKSFTVPSPYLLLANSVHTLRIEFTTNDPFYHVGSYYQVELGFNVVT
jgi:hypothetical protein